MKTYYIISGGFDPLHEGHIENIIESRNNSDGIIVLLNSDNWLIRKKKIILLNYYTRYMIMKNIEGVIDVISFDDSDESVCDGLRIVRKKYNNDTLVFAKGGDRTIENTPEADQCRILNIGLQFNVGRKISGSIKPNSSSLILEKFIKSAING